MKKIVAGIITVLGLTLIQSSAQASDGYAIVHPDGHVCGVIVANSNDPFGNGGTTTTEFQGCPSGSKIVFQTNSNPTGNVSGYQGTNVVESENKFTVSNDVGTVTTTIQNGIATDSSGTSWNTGAWSDKNPVFVDSSTATSNPINTTNTETSTVTATISAGLANNTSATISATEVTSNSTRTESTILEERKTALELSSILAQRNLSLLQSKIDRLLILLNSWLL